MNASRSATVPHNDPLVTSADHKRLRVFWYFTAAVITYLLFERLWFSYYKSGSSDWGVWVTPVYVVSFCILFLSEGVGHSAAQLHKADREGVHNTVNTLYAGLPEKKAKLEECLALLFANFEPFIIGRQIISLSAVALLAIAIENSSDASALGSLVVLTLKQIAIFCFPPVPTSFSEPVFGVIGAAKHFVSGILAAFLLSALIPCWFAQILPSLLTTTASLRFFDIRGAKLFVRAALHIYRVGTGLPGQLLANHIRRSKAMGFDKEELIGAGDTSTFKHLTSALGEYISSRKIELEIAEDYLLVTDQIALALIGKPRSSIDQTLRVAMTHCDPSAIIIENEVKIVYPQGIEGTRKQRAAVVTLTDSTDASRLVQELIVLGEARLETEIPRSESEPEQVAFTFRYMTKPLSFELDKPDVFFFEIFKPTQFLEITLSFKSGLFCKSPKIKAGNIEEVMFRDINDEDEISFTTRTLPGHKRILSKNYPRTGRYGLSLNVLRQKPGSC